MNQNGYFEEMGGMVANSANIGEFYTTLPIMYLTPMTDLGPYSYGSPNLLLHLELWEKFESNLLVMRRQGFEPNI